MCVNLKKLLGHNMRIIFVIIPSASGVLVESALPGAMTTERSPRTKRTRLPAPTRQLAGAVRLPRRAHPRRRTAAKRKADELEQIKNHPSGLVNRTVRDAARAEAFAWDVNGREFQFLYCCEG